MELTFVARPVPEEDHDDAVDILELSGKGGTDCYGETCTDYPVGAQHPDAKVGYVH